MIEFRNRFKYKTPSIFYILPSISVAHNKLSKCYFIDVQWLKIGFSVTISIKRNENKKL